MKKYLLILILLFSVASGAEFYISPTSNEPKPSEGGYKLPCYVNSIVGIANIDKKNIKSLSGILIPEGYSLPIPNGNKINVTCNAGFFTPSFSLNKPIAEFKMICDNGGFKRENPSDFCEKRCDIAPLKAGGYTILSGKTLLNPNEEAEIQCPAGETTRSGEKFKIQCTQGGDLNAVSPTCFKKDNACVGIQTSSTNGLMLPNGTALSCQNTYGLTLLSCLNKVWTGIENCNGNCQKTCKESIADINFAIQTTQNLNDTIVNLVDNAITVEEYQDFCKKNPNDKECKPELPVCKFGSVTNYKFGHKLSVECPALGMDKEQLVYTCYGSWTFTETTSGAFLTQKIPRLEECGKDTKIITSTEPKQGSESRQTLQEYKMEKLKSRTYTKP
jgi:hypothetical protein